ncbi:sensor histidine kinase [Streptomyces violaceorubidus]|uniref:sensor histidine kinase n=1 Tax=Streptomyces violaceorubidus TaxID=284042 RepID=UPI00142892BB|nr:nitrate- and nitrite sensing domain-containing protein [Streptomyces violaceorubidus]
MKHRGWSIRRKFTAMLALPLASLAVVCGYAAYLSLGNALTLLHVDTIGNHLAAPLGRTLVAVQHERREAAVAVTTSDESVSLAASRKATDAALAAFLEEAHRDEVRGAENDKVRKGVDGAEKSLAGLPSIREGVDGKKLATDKVLASYTAVTQSIGEALRAMTVLPDEDAQEFGQALYAQVPAGDLLSQEDALISAVAAAPRDGMNPSVYRTLVQYIGAQRLLNEEAVTRLPAPQRSPFLELAAPGGSMTRVTALEDSLIQAGPKAKRLPFPIASWRAAYDATDKVTSNTALEYISLVFTRTGPPAHRALAELVVAALLGLVSLIVSSVMSVRMVRSLLGDIGRLKASSHNLTEDRLRDVVGRLRRGETVDVATGTTRPVFVNPEMAELGAAFEALQSTAVELAQEDVRLHQGISQLFVNLSRRSQVLINRQLSMLDVMERHEEDANTLDRLFELDQLATRMRRYAEGLLIVSGAAPGRYWRHPVPAVDVIRGGVAETEQYARVVVLPVPEIGIQGRAAADVIHLIAELVENAEMFSPSDSEVRVSAGMAASGLVVEIDDRGLGMPPQELAAANERLNAPLDVTTVDSTRLGLITVGRLARRHHIEVVLRRSPYGGVNAVVLIPDDLLEWAPSGEGENTSRTAEGQQAQAPGTSGEPSTGRDAHPGPTAGTLAPLEIRTAVGGSGDPTAAPGMRRADGSGHAHPTQGRPRRTPSVAVPAAAPSQGRTEPPHDATASAPDPAFPMDGRFATPANGRHPAGAPDPMGGMSHLPAGPGHGPVVPAGAPHNPGPAGAPTASAQALPAAMPGPDDSIDGLPRRIPQASLTDDGADGSGLAVRRLMDWDPSGHEMRSGTGRVPAPRDGAAPDPYTGHSSAPASGPPAAASPTAAPWTRSAAPGEPWPTAHTGGAVGRPDQVRSMMSALQAGAARARVAQADAHTQLVRSQEGAVGTAGREPVPAPLPHPDYRMRGGQ